MELLHHVFSKFLLKGTANGDILDLMEQFGLIAKFSPSKTELLHHVFSKFLLKGTANGDILDLMEQFGLIAKFSPSKTDEKYFVPCQLRMPPNSICAMVTSSSDPCPLYVYFVTGSVPHGLFTRLLS